MFLRKICAIALAVAVVGGSAAVALPAVSGTDSGIVANATEGDREIVRSGSCGENVTYTLDNEGLLIISGSGEMYDYDDDRAEYYHSIFSFDHNIKQIVIEDSVTSIGVSAFDNCTSLKSVTISDSVISIGESAFSGCTSLTSITIPDSVTDTCNCFSEEFQNPINQSL